MHVADGKLQEQLSAVRKEITRLEYQNNELDKVRPRPPLPALEASGRTPPHMTSLVPAEIRGSSDRWIEVTAHHVCTD